MNNRVFTTKTQERDVTLAIVRDWTKTFEQCVQGDVIVVGAGPSGLVCARDLARAGHSVSLIECNNYLGGGFWIGGYLMNTVTIREPAQELLNELGVPLRKSDEDGLWVASGPHACSKLIASACDAGVRVLNMTIVEDVILSDSGRVEGVVANWTPVRHMPRSITCVDPVALPARFVVDATGHDAHVVKTLADRQLIELPGCAPMNVTDAEETILEQTGEVFPGLSVIGMAAASVYKLARMGPTFGAMLLSGQTGASKIVSMMKQQPPSRELQESLTN